MMKGFRDKLEVDPVKGILPSVWGEAELVLLLLLLLFARLLFLPRGERGRAGIGDGEAFADVVVVVIVFGGEEGTAREEGTIVSSEASAGKLKEESDCCCHNSAGGW